jgi:hypothetical protein
MIKKKQYYRKNIIRIYVSKTMAMKRKFFSVHSESATRAPVVPQLATGEERLSGHDQGRVQSATGVEFGYQARTGGTNLGISSQPGQLILRNCPGCGRKPGNGEKFSLRGEGKEVVRKFVQEERQRNLEKMGITYTPSSADVPLEQMRICTTCQRNFYKCRAAQKSENSQLNSSSEIRNAIELTIPRMASNRHLCLFGHQSRQLRRVPAAVRAKILVNHRLYASYLDDCVESAGQE